MVPLSLSGVSRHLLLYKNVEQEYVCRLSKKVIFIVNKDGGGELIGPLFSYTVKHR